MVLSRSGEGVGDATFLLKCLALHPICLKTFVVLKVCSSIYRLYPLWGDPLPAWRQFFHPVHTYCSDCEVSYECRLCLSSYLPVMICLHYAMLCPPTFNTVSLHSTAFDHCTVRYGTGRVGRYGHIYSYFNNILLTLGGGGGGVSARISRERTAVVSGAIKRFSALFQERTTGFFLERLSDERT